MSDAPDESAAVHRIQCHEGGSRESSTQAPSTHLVDPAQSVCSFQCIQVGQNFLADRLLPTLLCCLSIVASALVTVAGARFHPRTSSIVSRLHCYHLYYHCCAFNLVMLPSLLCFQSDDATIVAVLSMPVSVQCATDVAVVSIFSSCSMLFLLLL